jgi:hypothetical protein
MPFGKGRKWANTGKALDLIAGGRQLSSITTYRSGALFGTIAASCNTPSAGSCYADYNSSFTGPVRINGDYGSGDVRSATYVDLNAFKAPRRTPTAPHLALASLASAAPATPTKT